jgi:mono/diheme cytochrome c family protein
VVWVHRKKRINAAVGWLALALGGLTAPAGIALGQPSADAAKQRALVNRYCVACHNPTLKSGGISLAALDFSDVAGNSGVLEKVLRKVHSGEMPPAGVPRPDASTAALFTHWLETELDRAAAAHPNPGHPTIHRLNRTEYSNAIRDLLALDIKPGAMLPADDTGYGFDNIGDVLSLSPMLIERYMSVARTVSRLAVGDPGIKPEIAEFRPPKNIQKSGPRRSERVSDDLPFDSAGGLSVSFRFPLDAEYVIKFKLAPTAGFDGPQVAKGFELRLPVRAGTRTVAVTFPRQEAIPETIASLGPAPAVPASKPAPPMTAGLTTFADLRLDGARLKTFELNDGGTAPALAVMTIAGPYNVSGPGETPSREKIFVCRAADAKEEEPCARKIVSALAYRAFRRPVTDADIKPLLAFYERGRREGSFENGIETALRALLVSPDFLFRIERDPNDAAPGSAYRVSDFELASRLSFFLWSSMPDDELLTLAARGKLRDPAVISGQVNRMLDDSRSKSLVGNFAGQWLYLRNLAQVKPDPDEFPEFDTSLRQSFQRETELFFSDILRSERPVTDLLDARFTFVNQRLAGHYGIPNVYGAQFRRVALTDPNRGGILGQGSILTVTSYPNRTSVVQRGKWVLENLLGMPPPPPPGALPELKPHGKDGKLLTIREEMEQHRADATCAACHARMDPIGFSLENYNGIGKWRSKDAGSVIDASGKLPDGSTFEGLAGLKTVLLTTHRDDFIATVTERLLTYALGRGLESYDKPAVRSIVREASRENPNAPAPTFTALIKAIVNSVPFQMRRTPTT